MPLKHFSALGLIFIFKIPIFIDISWIDAHRPKKSDFQSHQGLSYKTGDFESASPPLMPHTTPKGLVTKGLKHSK